MATPSEINARFLDAAQAFLDAHREEDASVTTAVVRRQLPNGAELVGGSWICLGPLVAVPELLDPTAPK